MPTFFENVKISGLFSGIASSAFKAPQHGKSAVVVDSPVWCSALCTLPTVVCTLLERTHGIDFSLRCRQRASYFIQLPLYLVQCMFFPVYNV